jgi:hypothetical protein
VVTDAFRPQADGRLSRIVDREQEQDEVEGRDENLLQ